MELLPPPGLLPVLLHDSNALAVGERRGVVHHGRLPCTLPPRLQSAISATASAASRDGASAPGSGNASPVHRDDVDVAAGRGDEENETTRAASDFRQLLFHGSPIVWHQFIFHDGCICQLRRGGARRPRRLVESGLSRRLLENVSPSSIRSRSSISHMLCA